MSRKRLTRAEAQRGIDLVTDRLEKLDAYGADVQADVRTELGASIPPQHERVTLENDEQLSEHYKKFTRILTIKAEKDAEAHVPEADILKSAERLLAMRTAELERLKLEKTDPELDERQWQMLSDLKSRLLEYPALLAEVTGDQTFMQNIKTSYESKLEELEETLDKLTDDVFGLESACAAKVETALLHFAEDTMKPAISIVSAHHEKLQRELDEAEEESEQLKERIEVMRAEAEDAGTEKERLDQEHQAREESLTAEIAELKKMLEAERDVSKTQNEEHKRETADLKVRYERAQTIAAEEAKSLREDISSHTREIDELQDSVTYWREQSDSRREEVGQLQAKSRTTERQLRDAQRQVDLLEKELQSEKDAAVAVNERAEQEKESLRNELKVTIGLDEVSAKLQQLQPLMSETVKEVNEVMSTVRADAARVGLQRSVSRFEENQAKHGLGPTSPEKSSSKRRRQARQSSVGSAGMLTNFGSPEPLPEDLLERVPSQRGYGRAIRRGESARRDHNSSPLGRRTGGTPRTASTLAMDPATIRGQTAIFNPAIYIPQTLRQSSEVTFSATAPQGLSKASVEVQNVWAQIDFPANWDMSASNSLLQGMIKNTGKKVPERLRPVAFMDASSTTPRCLLRKLVKINAKLDNGDEKRCSACKRSGQRCVSASFMAEGLADVAFDAESQEKRWKVTLRED